jgi:hypothetical protein
MHFTPAFYRAAAVCSFVSAVTTLGLIFLPELIPPADDFAGRMARVNDPTYRTYSWVYLIHPFFTVAAALGVSMRLRRDAAALVIPGLLAFLLWGATEAGQQAFTLMAFNPWRAAWLAGDPAIRATMELRTELYDGLWNAMYFLIVVAFFIANLLYAGAMWRWRGLSRAVGAFYLLGSGPDAPDHLRGNNRHPAGAGKCGFLDLPAHPAAGARPDRRLAVEPWRREPTADRDPGPTRDLVYSPA